MSKKKTTHFRPKGFFRTFFNYLELTGNSHLEKTFIKKIGERNQSIETLKSILVEGGLSPKESNELIDQIKKVDFKELWSKRSRNISPSFKTYKNKVGQPKITNPKPLRGGSPGLGKRKS